MGSALTRGDAYDTYAAGRTDRRLNRLSVLRSGHCRSEGAQIVSFDGPSLPDIAFEETSPSIVCCFLNDRERLLEELLREDQGAVFEDDEAPEVP